MDERQPPPVPDELVPAFNELAARAEAAGYGDQVDFDGWAGALEDNPIAVQDVVAERGRSIAADFLRRLGQTYPRKS